MGSYYFQMANCNSKLQFAFFFHFPKSLHLTSIDFSSGSALHSDNYFWAQLKFFGNHQHRWCFSLTKQTPPTFVGGIVFALPIFPGRPTYCRGVGTVRWTVPATRSGVNKKEPSLRLVLCVRVTYLPGQSPAKYCRRTCA